MTWRTTKAGRRYIISDMVDGRSRKYAFGGKRTAELAAVMFEIGQRRKKREVARRCELLRKCKQAMQMADAFERATKLLNHESASVRFRAEGREAAD